MTLKVIFLVGLGGFAGANARYWLGYWATNYVISRLGWSWPAGTLLVNILGSFGLAVLSVVVLRRVTGADTLYLLFGAGFFGAFTTFSTFANETLHILLSDPLNGLLYMGLMNGACLLGVGLGLVVANGLIPAS